MTSLPDLVPLPPVSPQATVTPPPRPAPPTGCYYQQVQCIRAPCDPVLVCPTSVPVYTCPSGPWIDCMPGPGPTKPECSSPYLAWIRDNCPDFAGVAY